MSASVLSLLPSKNESSLNIMKRRNRILYCLANKIPYEGTFLVPTDENVQLVLLSLNKAVEGREGIPVVNRRPASKIQHKGKTENDRQSKSYLTPEMRKKNKSEKSQKIRNEMKSPKRG